MKITEEMFKATKTIEADFSVIGDVKIVLVDDEGFKVKTIKCSDKVRCMSLMSKIEEHWHKVKEQ